MGGGLVIIEPTTVLRDWLRTALDSDAIWAGGWPRGVPLPGIEMHPLLSTLNGPVTAWSFQFDSFAATQPEASGMSARLATHLIRTPPRTLIGANSAGSVLYGGAIESSVSISPKPPDSEDPGTYGSSLLIDLTTIAVPADTLGAD